MAELENKKIALCITGSIAAYKACEILRALQKKGADVFCVLTPYAKHFVSELTLKALSGNELYDDILSHGLRHTSLASQIDALLIAPATANTIAKLACGVADNPVLALSLVVGGGVIAPAMNHRMLKNAITQRNIKILKDAGWLFVEPEEGYLACGEEGSGRLADIDSIIWHLEAFLTPKHLKGKKFVVTAGPTREYIDPVRFISNPSSGKMGYALASAAAKAGAEVVLISGPTCLSPPPKVKLIKVETAKQMLEAAEKEFKDADVFIAAAAVGDFKPKTSSSKKIKKRNFNYRLELEPNVDVLKSLSERKRKGQVLIGFAAETDELEKNAMRKLSEKKLEAVIANDVKEGVFGSDETQVLLISKKGAGKWIRGAKEEVAAAILRELF